MANFFPQVTVKENIYENKKQITKDYFKITQKSHYQDTKNKTI
jgi:hypothetical protein